METHIILCFYFVEELSECSNEMSVDEPKSEADSDQMQKINLMASRRSLLKVRRLHRMVAIRIVRAFRTISAAAAAVLAGFPPFELQALRCREIYLHTRDLWNGVDSVRADVEGRARPVLLDRWRASLDMKAGAPGLMVLEAVLPNWDVWLDGAEPSPPP